MKSNSAFREVTNLSSGVPRPNWGPYLRQEHLLYDPGVRQRTLTFLVSLDCPPPASVIRLHDRALARLQPIRNQMWDSTTLVGSSA